jgi:hypothetical protein
VAADVRESGFLWMLVNGPEGVVPFRATNHEEKRRERMTPKDVRTHLEAEPPFSIQMNDGRSIDVAPGEYIQGLTHYVVHEDKGGLLRVLAIRNISGFTMNKNGRRPK